jgi:hypothetical protein
MAKKYPSRYLHVKGRLATRAEKRGGQVEAKLEPLAVHVVCKGLDPRWERLGIRGHVTLPSGAIKLAKLVCALC